MKCFYNSDNICVISSLDLETLESGGKAMVSGIVDAITTISDGVIATHESGVCGFGISNSRKKWIQGQPW